VDEGGFALGFILFLLHLVGLKVVEWRVGLRT
jgi:hypothetical protein